MGSARILVAGVLDHWERTGVLPQLVSSDDGYSSRRAREYLLATGVEVVSNWFGKSHEGCVRVT